MNKNTTAIILAAGKSIRMKSEVPKVMHPLCGRPMLSYVLDLAKDLKLSRTFVVIGHKKELLKDLLEEYKVESIYQDRLLGTADAIKRAEGALKSFHGNILVLYGDHPLLKKESLKQLIEKHLKTNASATILTAYPANPAGYGRIVRNQYCGIVSIVEDKDATDAQKKIPEVNTGIICFRKDALFKALAKIRPENVKKEYYLTDCIKIMSEEGLIIESVYIHDDIGQAQGINSRLDLAQAQKVLRRRILEAYMESGISIVDPETTYIGAGCKIGQDTIIHPFTVIENDVKIGKFCQLGPFCHLRSHTVIEDKTVIGNFTEVARSKIERGVFMKHFSYLGDASVGRNANIGCGVVTANFDGKNKLKTVIGEGAFIGSDTILRAPVKIGKKAVTAAGSVVTKDVKPGTVVVGVPARELKKKLPS
jgi:bifunctional UDP-N-acetylglucosamine pyrophosphorylase/glucosamine-1-phosphate N-acetyltransferase